MRHRRESQTVFTPVPAISGQMSITNAEQTYRSLRTQSFGRAICLASMPHAWMTPESSYTKQVGKPLVGSLVPGQEVTSLTPRLAESQYATFENAVPTSIEMYSHGSVLACSILSEPCGSGPSLDDPTSSPPIPGLGYERGCVREGPDSSCGSGVV